MKLSPAEFRHACRRHRIVKAEVMGPSDEYRGMSFIRMTDIEGAEHDGCFFYADEGPPVVEPNDLVGLTLERADDEIHRRNIAAIQAWVR